MFKPKNDGRPAEGRIEITKMKKILLSVSMLLALAFAPVSCDREKAEYGDGQQPVGTATGTLSLAAMTVVLSTETETHDAVVRPDAAAATSAPAACKRPPVRKPRPPIHVPLRMRGAPPSRSSPTTDAPRRSPCPPEPIR